MTDKDDFGVHEIQLVGETIELSCTPNAAFKLSRSDGGIAGMFNKLRQMDIEAYLMVIRAGANLSDKDSADLVAKVFRTGMMQLLVPLTDYLTLLCSGGVKPEEVEKKAEGKL